MHNYGLKPQPLHLGVDCHDFMPSTLQGFRRHVKKDHNMWAYIYYSMYLDEIDSTNHNAIEKYVYDKVRIKLATDRVSMD